MDATPNAKIAIHRLLAEFFRTETASQDAGPALARHPLADGHAILPPYLGEFGFEVRFFLGTVEPWLRNGWKIPARRPELYPPGSAFSDAEFFREIDSLKQRFECTEILFNLCFASVPEQPLGTMMTATSGSSSAVIIDSPDEAFYVRLATVERAIRRLVKARCQAPGNRLGLPAYGNARSMGLHPAVSHEHGGPHVQAGSV